MTAIPANAPRAELFAEKRKILIFNLGLLLASGFGWVISCYFAKDAAHAFGFLVGAMVFYIMFAHETWGLFIKSPLLQAHENGINFRGLGFWEWEKLGGVFHDGKLLFFLQRQGGEFPKKAGKIGAKNFYLDKEKDVFILQFEFPGFSSNVPVNEFYNTILRYHPNHSHPPTVLRNKLTWRTFVFGKENPSKTEKVLFIPSLGFLGSCFYVLINPTFFPSESWSRFGSIMLWVLTLLATTAYYWAYAKGKIKIKGYEGKKARYYILLLSPFMIYLMFWIGLMLGLGHAYTKYQGEETQFQITVLKKKNNDSDEHCLENNELGTGFMKKLCIKREHYNSLPNQFEMEVLGKKSWFGFVFEKYRIQEP